MARAPRHRRCRWTLIALDHAAVILEQQDIGLTLNEIADKPAPGSGGST